MSAPYDVPEAISIIGQLLLSQGGQEAFMRFLGDRGVTLDDLRVIWASEAKAEPPFIAPEEQ